MQSKGSVDVIGLKESIDLPKFGIKSVPAKIDTGADFSSIWASEISVHNNELSFCLFGPGNALYNGKKITTKKFETTSIKNSSGVGELRYKVKLMVIIGSRNISGTFTLADRSSMSYPVLIGRKLLRGKFIVDVSKMELHSEKGNRKEILVLASNPGEGLKDFIAELTDNLKTDKTRFEIRAYDDLVFSFDRSGLRIFEMVKQKDIASYDLVYFKSHKNDQIRAVAAAKYLQSRNVRFIDKELVGFLSHDKLTQYTQLALYGLPIPATICGPKDYLLKNANTFAKDNQWPLVYKEISADRGKRNYIARNLKELRSLVAKAKEGELYVLQKHVPNKGYLRVYVFGNTPSIAVSRIPHGHGNPSKTHLNNPRGSVNARLIDIQDLESSVKEIVVKSAKAMNRQIAGVDLIQDKKDNSWYILEVNNGPQLRTGSFTEEKQKGLAKFIDQQLNR
ncbi:MAG TPA: RimK/LysX family protein [Candidatus Saccharimonadales bacterium]|nr:RimK/LysX family protein [Candidatus Saccharimonadales bacterium]